jgi:glycosyltransferase involved in cell wall biosynthesis
MITVLLPVMDSHDITNTAIDHLIANAAGKLEIIVVDNGSNEVYSYDGEYKASTEYSGFNEPLIDLVVIPNQINVAGYGALLQVLDLASNDIILWMHNDVLIHESGWDTRIIEAFNNDPLLGIAGFFGGYGVAGNGGRIGSMGNMLGKVWGTPQRMHGDVMTGIYPAAVFDSLAIIINRKIFKSLAIDHNKVPPHHWNDRILPLLFLDAGYHAATIGIAFDHKGGVSSLGDKYRELAERWSREQGLEMVKDWDYTFYSAGERYFRELGKKRFPVTVRRDYSVNWGYDE